MHMQRSTSGAAGNGLGATMKYLRRTTSAAANNGLSTTMIPPCSAAYFEVNSEPQTGASPSVRLYVGPELSRCVHRKLIIAVLYNFGIWSQFFSSESAFIFNFNVDGDMFTST
jgi:hypothetical protein